MNILTSDVLVPVYGNKEFCVLHIQSNTTINVYGAYENLVSSVRLKRFNLLGSSSSSRAGMSSLGCVMSFSRYFVLKLVISVWIRKTN